MVYFAGFATAIYFLAPAPDGTTLDFTTKDLQIKSVDTDKLVNSLNSGMHKCVDLGKVATKQAATYIKDKIEEHSEDSG